ncbi:hypothetical protein [Nonomuraea zeae]|uniref:Tat pathway signal sequence domain protein n=1 Tax=Nonomuraea zeae TaxID=1642303 RepID=A0A5S4GZS1_9ACTN|nr:hypothetical protein [Nonomuraea zeae]TMR38407.1 hypothetical protein ETD85_04690 [Nonomuraea zeae]
MIKSLTGTLLVAAAATTLMAAPAAASTAGASSASVSASTATSKSAATASAQLIRTKVYFGRCRDTCTIKVRVTNISRRNLFNVRLNARLKVNGRKAGTCTDYVGGLRARRTTWAACTVRTSTLSNLYNDYLDGFSGFRYYASTYVSYRYYR